MLDSLWIVLIAFIISLGLTPLAAQLAHRVNMLDKPDNKLKRHAKPIPYLGGLAVYFAWLLPLITIKIWQHGKLFGIIGILTGATLIVVLGIIDDKYKLSPLIKFIGQILAALVLIICHMRLQFIDSFFWSSWLTVFWVVGITNAMNLIDIMDGLASGVSIIAIGVFFILAVEQGRINDMYILAALGGGLLGFIPYNFPRARIYLGDTGALLIGFVLAALAVGGEYSDYNNLAIITPILILTVPIFDTLFIIFIRYRRGVPIFRGSPDHIALRLVKLGFSRVQTVGLLWLVSILLGIIAYFTTKISLQWSVLVYVIIGVVLFFVGIYMGDSKLEGNSSKK